MYVSAGLKNLFLTISISYQEARSKVPTLKKERKAGEDDGGAGYKVAGKQLEREEIDPIIVGGKDKVISSLLCSS